MTPRRSHWSFAASSRRPLQSAGSDQIVGRDMRASAAPPGDSCTGFEDSWCAAAGLLSTPGCPCNGSALQRFMRACACCRRARKNIRAKSLDLMWLVSSGICFSGLKVRDWQNFLRLTNSLLGKERGLCCWQSFLTTALLKSFACPFLFLISHWPSNRLIRCSTAVRSRSSLATMFLGSNLLLIGSNHYLYIWFVCNHNALWPYARSVWRFRPACVQSRTAKPRTSSRTRCRQERTLKVSEALTSISHFEDVSRSCLRNHCLTNID